MPETTFDLTSLDPAAITALVAEGEAGKRGFIEPAVQEFVDDGAVIRDMSAAIDWPKNKDGSVKTVTQQVTALKQNIKNHELKVMQGKATSWPELTVFSAVLEGSTEPCAVIVNKTQLDASKSQNGDS